MVEPATKQDLRHAGEDINLAFDRLDLAFERIGVAFKKLERDLTIRFAIMLLAFDALVILLMLP